MSTRSDHLYEREQNVVGTIAQLRFAPVVAARGKGALLIDEDGRELIDLSGGGSVASVGYANPRVVEAVLEAVQRMPGISSLMSVHRYGVELAELLIDSIPIAASEAAVYLGLTGSDANSVALRAIRAFQPEGRIIAFEHSYHAGIGPAQGISGLWVETGRPAAADATIVPYGDLAAVEQAFATERIAAIFVEPIMSDGGLVIPEPQFIPGLRELCDRYGALLVIDEVKVGLGRTGKWCAYQHEGVVPDIVVLGKALGGGLPLSAVVAPKEVLNSVTANSLLTLAGNPISAAAGLATLRLLQDRQLIVQAEARGQQLADLLAKFEQRHTLVADVRSRGLVAGIELRRADGSPADVETRKFILRAWQLGVIAIYVGPEGNVVELTPPLVITERELDRAFDLMSDALSQVANGEVPDHELERFQGW